MVLIVQHDKGYRYSAWVRSADDARVKSARRGNAGVVTRYGRPRWSAMFDDTKLGIRETSDWDRVSPETHGAAMVARF